MSEHSERFQHGGNVYAHPGCTDFSANLNPLGIPQSARDALIASIDACAQYPDPACGELTKALAASEGVDEAQLVVCSGATDAFARICSVQRPRSALVTGPCYSGYEQALEQVGARVCVCPLAADNGFKMTAAFANAIRSGIDLAFVANPNNPTGLMVPQDLLSAILDQAHRVGALVVLDECFVDLTDSPGSNALLASHPNLVIVKAFTKTYALAGLRLGYALCADVRLAERLRAAGQPWAVSVPAQVAGLACLADAAHLERSRRLIAGERERLMRALRACGMRVVPGEANYLLFWGPVGLYERMLDHHILIRSCANYHGLDEHWYRIAVRMPQQNDLLISAFQEVAQ